MKGRAALFLLLAAAAWLFRPSPRPRVPATPLPAQIHQVVYGDTYRTVAALWLIALGVPRLSVADEGKYGEVLELDSEDARGWRVYQVPVRNPSPAVLVSRYQWRRLPRVQSLYDRQGLAAYINWANRPEAAGFRWLSRRRAEVRADLGPEDMILVRRYADGWSASVPFRPDPIGYLLLDPQQTGPVTITMTAPVFTPAWRRLPEFAVPYVSPGGILDGVSHRPPPFGQGAVLTIYGQDLGATGRTRVLVGGRPAEVLWAGENQINLRLPEGLPAGPASVVVAVEGAHSQPVSVEIGP